MDEAPDRITLTCWKQIRIKDGMQEYMPDVWDNSPGSGHGSTEYIRADLYTDLLSAADELADAVEYVDKLRGKVWALEAHDRMMIAISAYKKAKEKPK